MEHFLVGTRVTPDQDHRRGLRRKTKGSADPGLANKPGLLEGVLPQNQGALRMQAFGCQAKGFPQATPGVPENAGQETQIPDVGSRRLPEKLPDFGEREQLQLLPSLLVRIINF